MDMDRVGKLLALTAVEKAWQQPRSNTQALTLNGTCYTLDDDVKIFFVKSAFSRHTPHRHGRLQGQCDSRIGIPETFPVEIQLECKL